MRDQTIQFVGEVMAAYLEEQNPDWLFSVMTEDFTWIGTEKQDLCIQGKEMAQHLITARKAHSSSVQILDAQYCSELLSDEIASVLGYLHIKATSGSMPASQWNLQVTALCKITGEEIKLSHLHFSFLPIEPSDEKERHFVIPNNSNELLRQIILNKSAALKAQNEGLNQLTQNIPGGLFRCVYDPSLTLLQMSDGFLSMLGYSRKEIEQDFHNSFLELIHPEDRVSSLRAVEQQLSTSNHKLVEYRIICKDGRVIWVMDKGQLIPSESGPPSFFCILIDITDEKQAKEALRLSLERHEIIMGQTNDVIFEWDISTDQMSYSSNWEKKFGYEPLTQQFREKFFTDSHIYPDDQEKVYGLIEQVKTGVPYVETEVRILSSDDDYLWCKVRATILYDEKHQPIRVVGIVIDIDGEKRRAQKLVEKAKRDSLTRLYNKEAVQQLAEEHLQTDSTGLYNAILMIDIDNFKEINDTMGHFFGDAYLVEVASVIQKLFRSMDILGRIGGDEFLVYIKELPSPQVAEKKAQQVVEAFQNLTVLKKQSRAISCSVGVAVSPQHGTRFQDLYKNADYALYQAKKLGKNQYVLCDQKIIDDAFQSQSPSFQTAVRGEIDSNKTGRTLNSQLVEYVFRLLYDSIDIDAAVNAILEVVGQQFEVSRAYIFENTEDDRYCCNTYEWCSATISPQSENLRCISYEDLGDNYPGNFEPENHIFYCRRIEDLPPELYKLLAPQGIKSLLQCAILDGGSFKGFVGFDDCRSNRFWDQEQIDALIFISEILSTFLIKKRSQDRLERSAQERENLLDNQDAWIYVIDPQNYQMYYLNRKTKTMFPHAVAGMTCYSALFHRDSPCEICPLKTAEQIIEIYHPILNRWSLASAAHILWRGKDAHLITSFDVSRYHKE